MSSNSVNFPSANALTQGVAAKPGALSLDVLSGIHRGVQAPIENDACTIGSSPSCDLVLGDRDIAAQHLQLRFYGKQVAVNAVGGNVLIEGRPTLERGFGCRANLPITLVVGETKLRIGRNASAAPMTKRWGPFAAVALLALVMTPIVAVQAGITGLLPQRADAQASDPGEALTVASLPMRPAIQTDEEVVAGLREKLAEADLAGLGISSDGRRIDVSGQVPEERLSTWREIQQWFDRSHGGRYVLTSMVSAAAVTDAPRFVFQAVFFGTNPYVVDARGERRYPGASLQDGWMLKSIDKGQILVVRGNQEFKLTL